jgi:hypothetical protein
VILSCFLIARHADIAENLNKNYVKPVTLWEEHKLKVLENGVLRKIFGPKRNWRKLHSEKRHDLYPVPNTLVIRSRRMRSVKNVARMGGEGTNLQE